MIMVFNLVFIRCHTIWRSTEEQYVQVSQTLQQLLGSFSKNTLLTHLRFSLSFLNDILLQLRAKAELHLIEIGVLQGYCRAVANTLEKFLQRSIHSGSYEKAETKDNNSNSCFPIELYLRKGTLLGRPSFAKLRSDYGVWIDVQGQSKPKGTKTLTKSEPGSLKTWKWSSIEEETFLYQIS